MTTDPRFKNQYFIKLYSDLYANWQEGNRLGRQQLANDRFFPSTTKESSEGDRAATSPLGGKVW
jgi:hypothetical protein